MSTEETEEKMDLANEAAQGSPPAEEAKEGKAAKRAVDPAQEGDFEDVTLGPDALDGLPPVNLGALFMPPIWGPAHGIWITILYYPAWLLADNLFYGVYQNPQPLTVALGIIAALVLAGVTVVFARASQVYALHRAYTQGKTKEQYKRRQVAWAVGMGALAAVMLGAATFYNLAIRPTLGA